MAQQAFRFVSATDGTITIGAGGAIAGATTITATGVVTGGSLTDGTATIASGAVSGVTTIGASGLVTAGSFTDGTLTINAGSITSAVSVNASGAIIGGSLTDGQANITGGAITGATTITASGQISGVGVSAGAGAVTGTAGITVSGAVDFSGATGTVPIGAFALPVTDGSNGQVLKTDGSGGVTWQNDSGASTPGANGDILLSDGAGGFSIDASFNIDTTNELLQIGAGGSVYGSFKSNTTTVSSGSATSIDSFAGASYKGAKYVITAFDATAGESQTTELVVAADGAASSFVPFADVFTGSGPLFTVNVTSAASPAVQVTRTGSNNLTVRFMRQTIA